MLKEKNCQSKAKKLSLQQYKYQLDYNNICSNNLRPLSFILCVSGVLCISRRLVSGVNIVVELQAVISGRHPRGRGNGRRVPALSRSCPILPRRHLDGGRPAIVVQLRLLD